MQPSISRETIVDRRQPAIRWSAVLAGSAIAVGLWGVLQLLGIGVGLVAINPDDVRSMRPAVLGTTAFSTLAPLIALFVGGYVATRMANTFDRRTAATHGLVTWGIASIAGLLSTALVISALGHGASHASDRHDRMEYFDEIDAHAPIPEPRRVVTEHTPTLEERQVLRGMEGAGKGLVALSLAMLLSMVTAVIGSLIAMRGDERPRPHTTAPYPIQRAPDA